LTSTTTAELPSDATAIRPSAAVRPDFLSALAMPLAQPVDCGFHVAVGFGQGLLAVHHAGAGLVAQFFHHCSGNAHNSLFILGAPGLRRSSGFGTWIRQSAHQHAIEM
jgi:hypothetical protein